MTSINKVTLALCLIGASSSVSAFEVFNDGKNTLDLGGRFDVRYITGGGSDEVGDGASRVQFVIGRKLSNGWNAFGHGEWGVKLSTNTKTLAIDNNALSGNGDDGSVFLRQGFVGLEHETYGRFSIGKQWGTLYNQVLGTTDLFMVNGGSASGAYNFGSDGGFTGTGRAEKAVQYTKSFGDFTLSGQFQANENNIDIDFDFGNPLNGSTLTLDNFYSVAASYKTPFGLVIGAGINTGEYELDTTGADDSSLGVFKADAEVTSVSLSYGGMMAPGFYAAVVVSDMENYEIDNEGIVMEESVGTEILVSYRFENDWLLFGGYNVLEDDTSGGKYELSYVAAGVTYIFDEQTLFYVEGKADDSTNRDGSDSDIDDIITFGIRYNF